MRSSAPPLLGKTTPRIATPPLVTGPPGPCGCGCALTPKTSEGFRAVDFARDVLGIEPLPWQRWLLIHAMELIAGTKRFRFRTVLILVSRQNGKTTIIEVKNLFKLFLVKDCNLVISTAQDLDVAEESWDNAIAMIEATPDLKAELADVIQTNGKKTLKLTNGSRWKPKASTRKAGRGLSGDDVNLDELREHQDWKAWAAVTKTTMARPNPQTYAFTNAGDNKSIVLNSVRAKAIAAIANPDFADMSLGIFEWSAPEDTTCTCPDRTDDSPHVTECELRDPQRWAQANPSLGYTMQREGLESALGTDPVEVFLTECLCVAVDDLEAGVITAAQWEAISDPESERVGDVAIAVDISVDRTFASIAVFGKRADGLGHARLVEYQTGTDRIVKRLVELKAALNPVAIGMGRGTFDSLATELKNAKLSKPKDPDKPERGDLAVTDAPSMAAACSQLIDATRAKSYRVVPSKQLNDAATGAKTRQGAGGTTAWAHNDSGHDISPIGALTVARWAYTTRADVIDQPKPAPMFAFG